MTEVRSDEAVVSAAPAPGLGRQMAHALAWTAAGKWISQIFAWASTLIVVRLLSPSDFGLLGMATTFLGLVELLSEFGIGTAILTLRDLTHRQISQLNTAAVLLGTAGSGLMLACAIPLSHFFRAPELAGLVAVMGLNFIVSSFKSIPYALLQKELRFKNVSSIDAAQALSQALLNALLVVLGFRYWAIAMSALASSTLAAILLLRMRRTHLARPAFATIYESIVFSWRILVSRLSWYLYSNADFAVAGRVLGKTALGAYTVAWNLANLPGEKIVALVTSVTPTFFAAIQHDKRALRNYLNLLTEVLAAVILPIVSGFAVVAPDLVPLVLGNHWRPAILPMQILAIYTALRSVVALLPQLINVIGETRFGMWNSLATMALLPFSFVLASRWGVGGIASCWIAVYPLFTIPLYRRTFRRIEMPVGEYLRALAPAVVSTTVMLVCVLIAARMLPTGPRAILRLSGEVSIGAAVYLAAFFLLFGKHIDRYKRFLKSLRPAAC